MIILSISNFSCIKNAVLTPSPITVIIGPQGAGKSVTTKLLYFFGDVTTNFLVSAERGDSFEEYKKSLSRSFSLWFPPSAWGPGRFNINYSAGHLSVRVLRRKRGGKLTDEVAVSLSDWFVRIYELALGQFERVRSSQEEFIDENGQANDALDQIFRVRDFVNRQLVSDLGSDHILRQTFIPAGRAFFTSIGRLMAGIEQAGNLDPVTVKFARLFANVRDRNGRRSPSQLLRLDEEYSSRRKQFMRTLFGGDVKFTSDSEHVEAPDGRKIPFSSLSSGQQELLPMWSLVDYYSELDAMRSRGGARPARRASEMLYIEEPEAHLFPSAQSKLMEFLIGAVLSEKTPRNLIVTTHSPYIMSQLNVFIKAGQLARRKKRNQDINDVVPRECWISSRQLNAYSIQDGYLKSILDEDGMIDGTYLDSISEAISRQFSALLQIESEI